MEVVSASHGVLGPLLGKLTAFLADECSRLKGVRREISHLKLELASMHAALKEYTKIEDPNEQVKMWISLLRELAYDTEDCFDKFIHQLGNNRDHGGFKAFLRETAFRLKTLGSRCGIADQIDDLKARIKHVKELKDCYKLDDSTSSSATTRYAGVDPRLHALFAEESHLVGIEGPRDDLVNWMVEEGSSNHHPRVLSIVGFGGLGKTTLANEVYRKIHGDFQCLAVVSVSQKPDIKKIIKDIIHKVTSQDGFTRDIDIWDDATSIAKLRELLQDKRYLVIVDDIWSTTAWGAIKCAFPENNHSSRIIVTTRIVDVAKSCCPSGDDRVYQMKALNELHSRRLFFKRIFGSDDGCPEMMKDVSDKILKKCGGLPLAISSISGLLANKPVVKEEWEKVKRSIGSALEKNQSLEGMSHILSLSYNDLPSHLKTCLLYLSMFPEDRVIEKETLVRLWIAEGFISAEHERSPQEVAEQYFYELINKSMIQPEYIDVDGEVSLCRVHDMMLELIVSRAAEDNFVTVVGGGQTSLENHQEFIRRLSVQHIDDQELAAVLANKDLRHVRSLTVTSSHCMKHLPSLDKFEALRVLNFEGCSEGVEEYITKDMDGLLQLKYLGLHKTRISELPLGIVKLRDLVTLDLRRTSMKELPPGIVQLIKLQHLLCDKCCKVPDGIGNMRNLQVVPQIDITRSSVDAVEELGNLSRLNRLSIRYGGTGSNKYKRHTEILLASVHKLCSCKLQSLKIEGSRGSVEFFESLSPLPSSLQVSYNINEYFFADIQKHIIPAAALTNLVDMSIHATKISMVDGLQSLEGLPTLSSLFFYMTTGPKERLIVEGIGFPCLKEFSLYTKDHSGVYVTFARGAMPKLQRLELKFAVLLAKNDHFHLGIKHLPCLRHVTASLNKKGAASSNCKAARAAAALSEEAHAHPNHPTIHINGDMVLYYDSNYSCALGTPL